MKLRNSNHSVAKLVMIVSPALIAISALSGCGGGGGNTTTNNPFTTQPTTSSLPLMDFPAGKYTNDVLYLDEFRLAYTVNNDGTISVGIKAKTGGYLAIAIGSPHGKSDVWIGYVNAGQATLFDTHDASESGNHPLDTATGGTNDLTNVTGNETGGVTTIEFKRKLNTGDIYDLPLLKGDNIVTWAIGVSDDISQEHSAVGIATITVP